MAAASVSLVVSSAWISRASAASSIVSGRVRSSTSTEPVTQHASCSQTESIRITPSNSPRPLSPAASNKACAAVGPSGERVASSNASPAGANGLASASSPPRASRVPTRSTMPPVPCGRPSVCTATRYRRSSPAPRNLGRNNARSRAFNAILARRSKRLQGIVEAGGHRPEQPAGVGGLKLGGGDPQVLGYLVELGGGGPQGGDVDRADRLGGGQTQVVPAERVRRIDHGQARLGGLLRGHRHRLHRGDVVPDDRQAAEELDGRVPGGVHRRGRVIAGVFEEGLGRLGVAGHHRDRPLAQGAAGRRHAPEHLPARPEAVQHEDHGGGCQAGHDGQEHPVPAGSRAPPTPPGGRLLVRREGVAHRRTLAQMGAPDNAKVGLTLSDQGRTVPASCQGFCSPLAGTVDGACLRAYTTRLPCRPRASLCADLVSLGGVLLA